MLLIGVVTISEVFTPPNPARRGLAHFGFGDESFFLGLDYKDGYLFNSSLSITQTLFDAVPHALPPSMSSFSNIIYSLTQSVKAVAGAETTSFEVQLPLIHAGPYYFIYGIPALVGIDAASNPQELTINVYLLYIIWYNYSQKPPEDIKNTTIALDTPISGWFHQRAWILRLSL